MNKDPYNVLFIGRSGSGKDTQAELLQKTLEGRFGEGSVLYIYTGEHLRELSEKHEEVFIAKLLKEKVMDVGGKAPDFLACWAWSEDIIYKLKSGQHTIFSSSPRTALEAKVMDEMFEFFDRKNVFPILVDVAREEAFWRLKNRGRADDTDQGINARLDFYEKYVAPVPEYYETESPNKLIRIDGNPRDIQKIHQDILKALRL